MSGLCALLMALRVQVTANIVVLLVVIMFHVLSKIAPLVFMTPQTNTYLPQAVFMNCLWYYYFCTFNFNTTRNEI